MGRALLVAPPRVGPRLGAGFPRLAASSPARCLASVTRDRAPRASSGVPGAQHALSTTSSFASGSPLPPSPRPGGHLEGLSASAAGPRLPVRLLSQSLSGCGTCWVVPRLSSRTSIPKPSTDPESLCVFMACHSCQLRE